MEIKKKITTVCCLLTCVLTVAIPLVSEVTNRGRGKNGVPTVIPETEISGYGRPAGRSDNFPAGYIAKHETEYADFSEEETAASEETAATKETENEPTETVTKSRKISDPEQHEDDVKELTLRVLDTDTKKITVMSLEEYITCVVAAEMPYTFDIEALKAQAVAARSYAVYKMKNGSGHDGADVCTSYSHCASYITLSELSDKYGEKTAGKIINKVSQAVKETAGEVITYKGLPALALFHSSSWKYTESAKNVWGNDLPYLVSVSTSEEDSVTTVAVSEDRMTEIFGSGAIKVTSLGSTVKSLTSVQNDSGRQDTVTYLGQTVRAKSLRSLLGLRSCKFEYEKDNGEWIFTVHGYGHGVGMSQYGANEMAHGGSGYREILTHYYSGVRLEAISDTDSVSSLFK